MESMDQGDYFDSYSDLEVHKLMLEDSVRNEAYRKAVFDNQDSIKGKIVMDVGAGSGILSVFCAQAGAKKVYAVEASGIYKVAEDIIKENSFENVIEVINSRVEDVVLPNNEKVDIIISEWMGFYLLHEGMLDSVIFARDTFLKPNGLIFPESATLYSVPCRLSTYDKYRNLSGIAMTTFSDRLRARDLTKTQTVTLPSDHVIASAEVVLWIDLRDVTLPDLDNIRMRHLHVVNVPGAVTYGGLCLWFTCTFPSTVTEPVILSTDPEDEGTHWRQSVIPLPVQMEVEESQPIGYEISIYRERDNNRRYILEVTMLDPSDMEHPVHCMCYMTKCILARAVLESYENKTNST